MTNLVAGPDILEQLKALNESWCMDVGPNRDDGSKAADGNARVDEQQVIDSDKEKQKVPLTPLEKARNAISQMLSPLASSSEITTATTKDCIVPYLFSALHETSAGSKLEKDEEKESRSSKTPLPSYIQKNSIELRQMEWHVVLILELLCAPQSTIAEECSQNPVTIHALSSAIVLHREEKFRRKNKKKDQKKKKKKRKKDKTNPAASVAILSVKEKEQLLLDHLVDVLSRAPFLLPRDVPMSQFLNTRVLSSDKLFWERMPLFVKHIYEAFEIPNPYIQKPNDDKDKSLLLDSVLETKNRVDSAEGTKNDADRDAILAAKKRKSSREKLQAIAKNKKRQRLASLTSKKKHRGSHFHRNLDDISKLLDKTKLKERKSSSNNFTTTNRHQDKTRGRAKSQDGKFQDRSKRSSKMSNSRHQTNVDDLLTDPPATISHHKRKNKHLNPNAIPSDSSDSTKSNTTEFLLMTPRKTVHSDTSRIIGETPVPTSTDRRLQTVVGETPIAGNHSRAFQSTVGETPTSFHSTPMSSEYRPPPFLSPPTLSSPMKLPTSAEESTKQPVKLFGLLKRTNKIASRGSKMATNKNSVQELSLAGNKNGGKRKASGTSSIDTARAFLRSKTL